MVMADDDVGRKDIVSVVLPTKELQQDFHNDDQFESLPAAAASVTSSPPSSSSSSLLAVSAAQQSSTNIHLQAVNHSQSHVTASNATGVTLVRHRSQDLKEMLPALVLSIAIRAEFWRPLEKQGKADWIKY